MALVSLSMAFTIIILVVSIIAPRLVSIYGLTVSVAGGSGAMYINTIGAGKCTLTELS